MQKGIIASVLMLLTVIGCATPKQTLLGQDAGRGLFSNKNGRAGFASTTKAQFIEGPGISIDSEPGEINDPKLVKDVQIIGNVQIGAKDIIQIIKTKKGRPFSEATLEEDKRALMQKGWFIDVKPKVEKTPSGYIITFQFIERPILHYIKIIGNKAHTRKILLEEGNIKPGDALDPIAVHQAKERMEQFYRDSGYFRVHIEVLSGDQIGDRGAVYYVSEGPKQRIVDVDFEGNQIASSQRLKTLIQSKPGWFFWINSEFTRKKLEEDVETLTTYYRKLGFFYAKVDRKFVETEGYTGMGQNRGWVKVKFMIDEGPRCRVGDVRFIGHRVYNEEQLKKLMKLPKEKYFNQDMLEVDMTKIKEKYGELGYVFAQATPDPRIDDDYVDVVINVKEGPRCYLNTLKVQIAGNEGADPYTKLQPILNRMSLRPGDVLSTKEINASKRRLMASQLFNANPTQGAMPDIIFSYPEEAKEDEEKAALAAAGSQTRGQIGEERRPYLALTEDGKNLQVKMDGQWDEEDVEAFTTYFMIRPPKEDDLQPPQQRPEPRMPSASGEGPVQPMELNWIPSAGQKMIRREQNTDIYRGQQFVQPFVQSNAPASTSQVLSTNPSSSSGNFSGSITGNFTPPKYEDISQTVYSNQFSGNSGVGSIVQTNSLQAVPYQSTTSTPAAIQTPSTVGSYGMSGNQATNSTYSGSISPNTSTVYTPSNNSSQTNSLSGYSYPTSHLSPQSNNQYIGGAAIYNQGPVFTQHSSTNDAMPSTSVVLGNTVIDKAIANSAYGFDPNNPYGDKLYPVDGSIVVQETRTGQLMMSVAVSSDSGLMGRFVIEEQNFDILNFPKGWRLRDWKNAFRGKGQRFRIEAVPGTEVQRYAASWETPYLFDLDYSFGVNGFYYQRYYDEWRENRVGGGISFGKLWTPDFSTRLSLGGQQVKVYNPIYPAPTDLVKALGKHPMYTIGIDASHNTRDSEFMPTEGHLISFGVEQVLGDYQFVRGNIDLRKYFTLHERPDRSGRWVLGLRSSLSISETGTPIYERYFGGGFTNLRGFDYRSVSPRDENGIIIGGCMEFYNSAELIFPITADDMIRGSFFVDSGTVERSISNWESKYRVAVGFGLRLTIPMMGPAPIALDFAFPINKEKSDEKQIFSFNVGFMR